MTVKSETLPLLKSKRVGAKLTRHRPVQIPVENCVPLAKVSLKQLLIAPEDNVVLKCKACMLFRSRTLDLLLFPKCKDVVPDNVSFP